MIAPTSQPAAKSGAKSTSLFTTADGRNLFVTFILVTSLFLLWGFCNGMIDILNKHFQDSLHINKQQSGLVQSANYLAYFLMAIPAGLIARKFGYKGGILVGLTLIAGGAFWFIPATNIGAYWAFLLGLFIIAAGMTCLETIANPYTTVLGPPESGATRINIAQTINGGGWILGPIVGGHFVFSGGEGANANAGLSTPYMGIGIFVAILLVIFAISKVPDLHAEDESRKSAEQKKRLKPSSGQLLGIGVALALVCALLYFFIAPILGLIWALLNMNRSLFQPTKYALLVVAFISAFILVSKNWDMFRRKHFTLGIGAQFLYVAAQTGIFSFFVNYVIENDSTVTKLEASTWLGAFGFGLFMVGRLAGSVVVGDVKPRILARFLAAGVIVGIIGALLSGLGFLPQWLSTVMAWVGKGGAVIAIAMGWAFAFRFIWFMLEKAFGSSIKNWGKPQRALLTYALINVVLTAVIMGGGKPGLYALFGTFFFMSIMFPTIFALGIRGLGDYTKLGASLIVMSIVGGAIAAPFMGHIADEQSMRVGFAVPLVCFVLIAVYGAFWHKLESKDSGQAA